MDVKTHHAKNNDEPVIRTVKPRDAQGIREGVDRLRRLSEALSKREPRNVSLHLKVSRPFARVCGRDPVVLQLTIGMLESVKVRWRERVT